MIQDIKEDNSSVLNASSEDVPQSTACKALHRVMQTVILLQWVQNTLVPNLGFLGKKHPLFAKYYKFVIISQLVYLVIILACVFLLNLKSKKNAAQPVKKWSLQRCSKLNCSRCDARRAHPKWFKFKYWLLFLFIYFFMVFFVMCIQVFFAEDQTISLPRLLNLFGLQSRAIFATFLMTYCIKQYNFHSSVLETRGDCVDDEKRLLMEEDIV
ncbi:DUF4668 domain-containing protein SKDI_03G0705 [Saccharomyces kudriavzevii IFO 1802]|uniref:SKDI03G0705 protein n=2 Tax=Saccharomyces kudriavzevii (strain ATCC MYA-4449 / AS 2.2408 / CBS 8840 / NBRC 1802 / NCYC 2889) TaxID=226230 RepID=A0AA35JD23_SACK1|nr:uncharacterized protein SKDI_03G0705 [Saccharomyces kudriavzevii IFO 1802]EJT44562.1 hypothetical protein SKUD_196605 [Saccharomyces kudriavzevii IFO 1802]CAI4056577.1 SKDI03G0705 [Saccharomyces kudriavzevii IFO 1802]